MAAQLTDRAVREALNVKGLPKSIDVVVKATKPADMILTVDMLHRGPTRNARLVLKFERITALAMVLATIRAAAEAFAGPAEAPAPRRHFKED